MIDINLDDFVTEPSNTKNKCGFGMPMYSGLDLPQEISSKPDIDDSFREFRNFFLGSLCLFFCT